MSNEKDYADLFENVTGETTVTEEQDLSSSDKRVRGDESDGRSTTEVTCSDCGHNRAYYEMKQIRAADESETRFFECGYKWREDDH